jgi:magnesium chelatase family protein
MIINTIFHNGQQLALGEVEVQMVPGLPNLHIIGLPDTSIKECGIRVKAALKSSGFKWPKAHQFVINIRPADVRKSRSGVELAMALGIMDAAKQLPEKLESCLEGSIVYGELGLGGEVFAPKDIEAALHVFAERKVVTGRVEQVRSGRWFELCSLENAELIAHTNDFRWEAYWQAPVVPRMDLHRDAARALVLTSHMNLNALLAGPQGSGKTTWAHALYALTPKPVLEDVYSRVHWFGESELQQRWRPFEQPHHSTTPLAMIGGGSSPIRPGVITRAHGGLLLMDEFLEFHPQVLESLREPVESGSINLARVGARQLLPARFQLVGTTNLCRCGKLTPLVKPACSHSVSRCRSVVQRLSGPVLDRFDLMVLSDSWLNHSEQRVSMEHVKSEVDRMARFREKRGLGPVVPPDFWVTDRSSYRRQRALLRVARALADEQESVQVEHCHFIEASNITLQPIEALGKVFG